MCLKCAENICWIKIVEYLQLYSNCINYCYCICIVFELGNNNKTYTYIFYLTCIFSEESKKLEKF